MTWRTLMLLSLLMLAACKTTRTLRMAHVIGTWHGSSMQPHNSDFPIHWVVDRSAGGTFSVTLYEEKPCGLSVLSREAGRWGLSNGFYTAVTTQVDGEAVDASNPFYQDVYEVLGSSRRQFRYRSITHDITFESTRVNSGYMPSLPMCAEEGLR